MSFDIDGEQAGTAECVSTSTPHYGFSSTTVTAPTTPGEHRITGTSLNGSEPHTFNVIDPPEPLTLSLQPSSVEFGGTFTATATNCEVGDAVSFLLEGASTPAECEEGEPTTSAVELTAPGTPGDYEVSVSDPNGSATATLTVLAPPQPPTLALDPSTTTPGGVVTATFQGCAPGVPVQITVAGTSVNANVWKWRCDERSDHRTDGTGHLQRQRWRRGDRRSRHGRARRDAGNYDDNDDNNDDAADNDDGATTSGRRRALHGDPCAG